jgi:2-(1,2-epoxy-1,2-dihydrophenyl)acetyl-CoA isomerase
MSDREVSYRRLVEDGRRDGADMINVERRGATAIVTMNDPTSLNPLNAPLTVTLLDRLGELAADFDTRVIVLTGAEPAFSAGGDVRAMKSAAHPMVDDSAEGAASIWRWIRHQFGGVVRTIAKTDKVFIAAVNGPAAGVGLAFALAADIVVASERARLVTAFGPIGLVPEVGTSWLLTRRLGYQKTFELYLDGRSLDAKEALSLGLVNEVVPHEQVMTRALYWATKAEGMADHLLAITKTVLRNAADLTWDQSIAMEEFAEPMCFTAAAHRNAVDAFLSRRAK